MLFYLDSIDFDNLFFLFNVKNLEMKYSVEIIELTLNYTFVFCQSKYNRLSTLVTNRTNN